MQLFMGDLDSQVLAGESDKVARLLESQAFFRAALAAWKGLAAARKVPWYASSRRNCVLQEEQKRERMRELETELHLAEVGEKEHARQIGTPQPRDVLSAE